MSGGFFGNAGTFIISVLFGAYILLVMLRFIMQWQRTDFYNPLAQAIVKLTNPPLLPLRKIIPGFGGLDFAALLLMLLLQMLEVSLIVFISSGHFANLLGILVLSIGKLVTLFLYVYIVGLFVIAILSWIAPHAHSPVLSVIRQIVEPLLYRVRKFIPPVAGLDLSVFFAIMVLFLTVMLVEQLTFLAGQMISTTSIF